MVIVRTMQVKLWNGHFKIGEQAGWLQGWENTRMHVCLKNAHEHGLLIQCGTGLGISEKEKW